MNTVVLTAVLLVMILTVAAEDTLGFHDQRTVRRLALIPVNSVVRSCPESDKPDIAAVPIVFPQYSPLKTSFSPWGGKRNEEDPLFNSLILQKRQFSPWGGKRSPHPPLSTSWSYLLNPDKDDDDFNPWGGKRNQFNPWGGKRSDDDGSVFRKKRSSVYDDEEDVEPDVRQELKRENFNAWGGKRGSFNAWGGKRGSFNAWGGKRDRAEDVEDKRDSFNAWGGKRSDDFSPWGGKRDGFNAWGGKRDSFNAWGGKRDGFNAWGGKRDGFNAWGGKRDGFNAWGGKRDSFNAWGGKRAEVSRNNDNVSKNDTVTIAGTVADQKIRNTAQES